MHITFENKVALVTGAASELGLATAKAFAAAGVCLDDADGAFPSLLRRLLKLTRARFGNGIPVCQKLFR